MDSSNFLPHHVASSVAECVLAQARCWHGVDRGLMGAGGKTWGHGELWTHAIMQWVACPTNMRYLYLYLFILSTNCRIVVVVSILLHLWPLSQCPGLSVA